mgnify:CR=1 FL=1
MKNTIIFAVVLFIAGCTGGYEKAENAQDAGREFIRASLDGDYKKARFYLLKDSTNMLLIESRSEDQHYHRPLKWRLAGRPEIHS